MLRALGCLALTLTLSAQVGLAQVRVKPRRPLIHAGVVTAAQAGRGVLKVAVGGARAARNLEFRLADDVRVTVWENGERVVMTGRQALDRAVFKKGARVRVHVDEAGNVSEVVVGRPRPRL